MANPRVSTAPLRLPHAPASRELIAAKRREYLALCEIAQDSAQLEKNLRATASQQALMKEGGAALSKAMGNWLVILRTVSLYAEDFGKRQAAALGEGNPDSDPEAYSKMLLRVELEEAQASA